MRALFAVMSSLRRARDGSALPAARRVSFTVNTDTDRPHYLFTTMLMQWGQFVDHDLALTAISKISTDPSGEGGATAGRGPHHESHTENARYVNMSLKCI